jgi:hypothetical protein
LLQECGLESLAAIEFRLSVAAICVKAADEVLTVASDAECIDAWLKATKTNSKAFAEELQSRPDPVYQTAGLEWLLERVAPNKLSAFISKLLCDEPRPGHLTAPAPLVARFLESDSKGVWLDSLLKGVANQPTSSQRLVQLIRYSPKSLGSALRHLPAKVSDKAIGTVARQTVERLFEDLPQKSGNDRLEGCAQLMRMVAELLSVSRPGATVLELLKSLGTLSRTLRLTATSRELRSVTWVSECLVDEAPNTAAGVGLNSLGARLLAQALVSVSQGANAQLVLEALAKNIGLCPIGEADGTGAFDPKIHEDTVGGLLPGEPVKVLRRGWKLDRETVLRASVKPNN